jgi:hypothetical protein
MAGLRLSGEKIPEIVDPTWETVEAAIVLGNFFVTLDREGAGFVQTRGEFPENLFVEYAVIDPDGSQRQYRLARRGARRSTNKLRSNEAICLDLTDALVVFEEFFKNGLVPRHYDLLDITDELERVSSIKPLTLEETEESRRKAEAELPMPGVHNIRAKSPYEELDGTPLPHRDI